MVRLGLPNSSYRMDRNGAGYDFEIDPEPEHPFEI